VIGREHVADAIAREQMSSTAFTETLAVPHSMSMNATPDRPRDRGLPRRRLLGGRNGVHVVVFAAFSEADRDAFQTVFEQFVGAFSEPERVQSMVRRVRDLPGFLNEVTQLIEE
jgi:lichenan operon transcriptional antiterminator